MDSPEYLALAYGVVVGIIHFFGENMKPTDRKKKVRVISFAAGVSIAYLFLELLPKTYEAATHLKQWVFIFLLLGFFVIHLGEKWIYQHTEKERMDRELEEIHMIAFFIYNFIVGIVLLEKVEHSILEGSLFLIPICLHAALSTASMSNIHSGMRPGVFKRFILPLSALYGMIFALLVNIPAVIDNIFISLIAGVLLYIFVREFIPEKEKGQPAFFAIGVGLFAATELLLVLAGH